MFKTKNIALFADPHLGIHQNSSLWHNISLEFIKDFKRKIQNSNIEDIVILGDVHDDRSEIAVNTLDISYQFFKELEDFNIKIILGNHDIYYKDKNDIHSLSLFKRWNNVEIIDKPLEFKQFDKKILFMPWNTEKYLDNIKEKYDIIFGHFEINGFYQTLQHSCVNKLESKNILEKAKKVMSGHFHINDERIYSNGEIIYLGSPYELNWNDYGVKKGFYLMNVNTLKHIFIENFISPKHKKIRLSELLNDKSSLSNIKNDFNKNIINFIIDQDIQKDKLELLLNKLEKWNSLILNVDYEVNNKYINTDNKEYQYTNVNIDESIKEFIKTLDIPNDKNKIIEKTIEIYQQSLKKV